MCVCVFHHESTTVAAIRLRILTCPEYSQANFFDKISIGNGPNMVSESTVSNTELSELFGPRRVPGRELSEFLSAYYLCAKANSPSLSLRIKSCELVRW